MVCFDRAVDTSIKDLETYTRNGILEIILKNNLRDFPGGTVVKNLPANAGDTGSSSGPERSHMPWSN